MQFSGPLKQNHLFRRAYSRGKHEANSYLALYCRKNGQGCNRVGLTVSAKLGHAVRRNRVRRRLREIYRLHELQLRCGYDIVIVARSRAMDANYQALERAFLTLAERLKLLRKDGAGIAAQSESSPAEASDGRVGQSG